MFRNMLEPYRYKPLSAVTKPDTIRLLELLPRSGDEQIVCTIIETALSDNPEYKALSCCWAKDKTQEPVIIRHPTGTNFSLRIGVNLFAVPYVNSVTLNCRHIYGQMHSVSINQMKENAAIRFYSCGKYMRALRRPEFGLYQKMEALGRRFLSCGSSHL